MTIDWERGWVDEAGWPGPFKDSVLSRSLEAAILKLDHASDFPPETIHALSKRLIIADEIGRAGNETRMLAQGGPHETRRRSSQRQLERVAKRTVSLLDALENLKAPAHESLARECINTTAQISQLKALRQAVGHALSEVVGSEGLPPGGDQHANEVSVTAAKIYAEVTNCRPTHTLDPNEHSTARISGPWPDFLEEVFELLGVSGSAKSRAAQILKHL